MREDFCKASRTKILHALVGLGLLPVGIPFIVVGVNFRDRHVLGGDSGVKDGAEVNSLGTDFDGLDFHPAVLVVHHGALDELHVVAVDKAGGIGQFGLEKRNVVDKVGRRSLIRGQLAAEVGKHSLSDSNLLVCFSIHRCKIRGRGKV